MFDGTEAYTGMTIYTIYGLVDSRTDKVFYIGMTSLEPKQRLGLHLSEARKGNESLKNEYIRGALAANAKITIRALDEAYDNKSAHELEEKYIAETPELTNISKLRHPKSRKIRTDIQRMPSGNVDIIDFWQEYRQEKRRLIARY